MYGLVLEGGGAKGSYHVGAYKALLEQGISIGAVAGTSIGALNGAMIVQGDFDVCLELWEDISYSRVVGENDDEIERLAHTKLGKDELVLLAQKLKSVISDKGFDTAPFRRMLDTYVDEERIRKSEIDFGLVTFNLSEMRPVQVFKDQIPQGEMKNYLLASSFLPVFRMERLGGKLYLDGGVYDNLPFRMLLDKGYDDLVIVRTHINARTREILPPEVKAIIIEPSEDIGRSYSYEKNMARHNIQLGYYDAMRQLKGLRGSKYYFLPKEERFYFEFFSNLSPNTREDIADILGVQGDASLRLLFEELLPRIGKALEIDQECTYEDLALNLLERLMLLLGRNRFMIYDFEDASAGASCLGQNTKSHETGRLIRLKERLDYLSPFNKEELLIQIARTVFCNRNIWRGNGGH